MLSKSVSLQPTVMEKWGSLISNCTQKVGSHEIVLLIDFILKYLWSIKSLSIQNYIDFDRKVLWLWPLHHILFALVVLFWKVW